KIVSAAADGFDGSVDGIKSSNENHGDIGIDLQGLLEKREAVHARHFHVGKDNAASADADLAEGIVGTRGAERRKTKASKLGRGDFDEIRLIVEDANRQILAD